MWCWGSNKYWLRKNASAWKYKSRRLWCNQYSSFYSNYKNKEFELIDHEDNNMAVYSQLTPPNYNIKK